MTQPEDELQRQIRALNASLELTCPWKPKVDEEVEALYFGEWVTATVLSCPSNDPDPRRRISGWKIRLDSGQETYVWKSEHLRPFQF